MSVWAGYDLELETKVHEDFTIMENAPKRAGLSLLKAPTVGVIRNGTLVFVNFLAQDASIFKISVPIIKRRSWGFQNTPNLWSLDDFGPSYANLKKIKMSQNNFDWRLEKGSQNIAFLDVR